MHLFLLLLVLLPVSFFPQNKPKQITSLSVDSRNPRFLTYPWNNTWAETEVFFEAAMDSISDIMAIKYDAEADSFYELTKIFSNNFTNRNVVGHYIQNYPGKSYKMILWETNQSGNWDIVFSIDSSSGWTNPEMLFNTEEDETDVSFILNPFSDTPYDLIYSRGNSVLLYSFDTVKVPETIFQGNDTIKYSNPVIADDGSRGFFAAAEMRVNNGDPLLVYRKKAYPDTIWGDIKYILSGTSAVNPKFIDPEYNRAIAFETLNDGQRKVKWIFLEELEKGGPFYELLDDKDLETSDFSVLNYYVVTKKMDDYYFWWPFAFRYVRNDSAFIRSGDLAFSWPEEHIDIYSKVKNTPVVLGVLGYVSNGAVSYTIWEDSSTGRINLFGLRRVDPLGTVSIDDPVDFELLQNFPNPFNPVTKIVYSLSSNEHVTLKVYDILGNEITTLVNKWKLAGRYEVEFNAGRLASGVYIYKLTAGRFMQTRKLLLLK